MVLIRWFNAALPQVVKASVLLVLWLGVVSLLLGLLLDLVVLPFRAPPNTTPLLFLYQDYCMGLLALKVRPRWPYT